MNPATRPPDVTAVVAAPETPDVVVGNHCHKYTTTNPLIRWLTAHFLARLEVVLDHVAARTPRARVLEVGCGEGEIAQRLHRRWDSVTALDLPDAELRDDWRHLTGPAFLHGEAERMPFADRTFDVVVSIEVIEHLREPEAAIRELARVGREHLVLSVPREPIFRLGNLACGRHLGAWGNTPGHLHRWSTPGFIRLCSRVGAVREVATPFPWTILWVRLH